MPIYLQIVLLVVAFALFVIVALFAGGWGVRRMCFKIIAEMEEAGAFSAARAVKIQDERKNIFRVGTGNLRPKALQILTADGLVSKTNDGKYFLNREKLELMKNGLKK